MIRRDAHRATRRRLSVPLVVALGVPLVALSSGAAAACARDGVPSVSANGHLAVLNRVSTHVAVATWSPFIFARPVGRGRPVSLAENNREVARALPRAVFAHPWRWDFGDHSRVAYGTRVQHTYRKAGTYRIAVFAYYAVYASWQPFDYVTIRVK